jgi:hypothetical protein
MRLTTHLAEAARRLFKKRRPVIRQRTEDITPQPRSSFREWRLLRDVRAENERKRMEGGER